METDKKYKLTDECITIGDKKLYRIESLKDFAFIKKGDKGDGDSTRYAEVTPTQTDYNPQGITNVTGEQETQNLANAMTKSNIWVSVKDIDAAQSKVKTRDKEATF